MARYRCAVIIPTKNAMHSLPRVMDKVLSQNAPWMYEIVAIDSGSRDGTREYLNSLERVRLIEIDAKDFGHGRTRNLGVKSTDADFVAFLTHDATPFDENWLFNLVAAAEQDDRIAGVFGRHVAYETASAFTKRDLDLHFGGFLQHPLVVGRDLDPQRYETDQGWRQLLHFYSDNNSLMRRSVWDAHPYPDVEFAEDQLWARTVIEAGYLKAYAPNAIVYHSHDYSFREQLRRAFDESRNFEKYFGYQMSAFVGDALLTMVKLGGKALTQRIEEHYGNVTLVDRLRRATRQIALVIGHSLGTNHRRIPTCLAKQLSLDQKLFEA